MNKKKEELEKLISLAEAAEITGYNPRTIRNQVSAGKKTPFPVYKHPTSGKLVAFASDALTYRNELLSKHRVDVGERKELRS